MNTATVPLNWSCKHTWRRSAKNTGWCVLGCSIGDFGTILFFQLTQIPFPVMGIMTLAIINGLLTSIALETFILMRQQFTFINALKTACGMSFISMLAMEIAMNTNGLYFNRRRNAYMVGGTYYVNGWIFNAVAL